MLAIFILQIIATHKPRLANFDVYCVNEEKNN